MSHLLLLDTFDRFFFIKGEVQTCITVDIDGYMQKEFFDPEDVDHVEEYARWERVRPFVFSLIKGKHTPLGLRLIFCLSPEDTARLIRQNDLDFQAENVQGLYLNLRFDGSSLQCITGTSLKTFVIDKSLEHAWDKAVQKFLAKKEIDFEEL